MKTYVSFRAIFFLGLAAGLSAEVPVVKDPLLNEKAKATLRELEHSMVQAAGSVELARHIDLGEKTIALIEQALPAALQHYDIMLRGSDGLLKNDAGRFLSQNSEVVETLLRFSLEERIPDPLGSSDTKGLERMGTNLNARERAQRAKTIRQSIEALQTLTGTGSADFDPKQSQAAIAISDNAAWAARAFEQIDNRNTLIAGYQAAVPKGVQLTGFPTLEEEIVATLARRIATQEAKLNEVEKGIAEQKTAKLAEATKGVREQQLEDYIEHLKGLAAEEARLAAAGAARDRQKVELRWRQELAANKAEYDKRIDQMNQERADLDKKLAELAVQLDQKQAEIKKMQDKVAVSSQLRKLPQDAKIIMSILSAPGFYRPTSPFERGTQPMGMDFSSRYEGLDPQPHSLKDLAACGALDETPRGIMTMSCILAVGLDKERPRFQSLFRLGWNPAGALLIWPDNYSVEFTKSETARTATKKIREMQKLVREYGEELVASKLLAP